MASRSARSRKSAEASSESRGTGTGTAEAPTGQDLQAAGRRDEWPGPHRDARLDVWVKSKMIVKGPNGTPIGQIAQEYFGLIGGVATVAHAGL
jgi:hypothetical protein